MSAAVLKNEYNFRIDPALRVPLAFSVLFHACIVAFAYYGMPYIKHDPVIIESVPVELVSAEEASKDIKAKRTIPQKNESPAPPPRKPAPPKMSAETPSEIAMPKPPALNEEISKPVTPAVPPPKPDKLKRKPAQPVQNEKEPEAISPDKAGQFGALLRNLTPHAPENPAPLTSPDASPLERFASQVSMGEMDALRSQLASCWNVPIGAEYAENLVVEVRIFVNPDRSVRDAQVLNSDSGNPFFRTAAESALRAVYSPQCNPLNLPPTKYDQWNTIVVRFDPREMLQ